MALFINTRPLERQTPDHQNRDHHDPQLPNWHVYSLPLLTLVPRVLNADEKTTLDELVLGKFRLLVVVSVTACQYALNALSNDDLAVLQTLNRLGNLNVIAVGQATAKALRQAGFLVLTPDEMSNEGMLAMACVKALTPHDKVLIWRGVGGRTLFFDTLQATGIAVSAIAFYERVCPDTLPQNTQILSTLLPNHDKIVMLISSEMAFLHWQDIAQKTKIDHQALHYLALGKRLTTLIAPYARVTALDSLDKTHVAQQLSFIQKAQ